MSILNDIKRIGIQIQRWNRNIKKRVEDPEVSFLEKTLIRLWIWLVDTFTLLKETIIEYIEDDAISKAAAFTYYMILSLPSVLYIIITAAGPFLGEETVKQAIVEQISEFTSEDVSAQFDLILHNLSSVGGQTNIALINTLVLFFVATLAVYTLQNSLNTFWKVHKHKKVTILQAIFDRFLALMLILALAFSIGISLVFETTLFAINEFFETLVPDYTTELMHSLKTSYSLVFTSMIIALIFKYLPDAAIKFRDALFGGFVTASLMWMGQLGIGWYLAKVDFTSSYGAAGSLVIVMLWTFYTSQVLFFGAIFTYVYTRKHGKGIRSSSILRRLRGTANAKVPKVMTLHDRIQVEKATADDLPSIINAQVEMALETEDLILHRPTVELGVNNLFDHPEAGYYVVARLDDKVIGNLLVLKEWSDWRNGTVLWIHSLFIKNEYRHKGVFKMMYDRLKSEVKKDDKLKGIRLYVDKQNVKAQAVYEQIGMSKEHYEMYEWLKD
ncbi:YhjD/YihY/BrkB family envelope integrity protein [Sediminitomix flava]|nr:YhjD/YihY/BrkB family envelope integrity protein [Sediminitomix flava]